MKAVLELQEAIRASRRFRVAAGGSKPALSRGSWHLDGLSGLTEYDPQEFTVTALAGTSLTELRTALDEHRQYLPFDPPFRDAGATIGGTVAAGLSGPGSFRFGGVRDFILGVKLVDGRAEWFAGGGKVVKNAAGFDLPKLMVGSLGEFGIMTEVTMKVFPRPQSRRTLVCDLPDLAAAVSLMARLGRSQLELSAIELQRPDRLVLQLNGSAGAARERLKRAVAALPAEVTVLEGAAAAELWTAEREFTWLPEGSNLLKIACNPAVLLQLDALLEQFAPGGARRYGLAGHVCYAALPRTIDFTSLEAGLQSLRLGGLPLIGDWPASRLGWQPGALFADRIRSVLDPEGKFRRLSLAEKVFP